MPKYTSSRDYDDESDDNHYGSADDYGSADGDNESADSEHGSADDVVVPDSGCPVAKLLCWLVNPLAASPLEASRGT